MLTFTVKSVRRACSWINGIEAHLDAPIVAAGAKPRSLLTLSGWVASRSEPIKQIWVACVGRKIAGAKLSERPDVAGAYPAHQYSTGFEIAAVPLGLGASEPLKLMLESGSGKRTMLFEVELDFERGRAQIPASAEGIVFAPIVALPRSGTTYLSQLLHTSDAVLGDDQYPYELRFAEQFAGDCLHDMQPWAYAAPADRTADTTGPNFATACAILGADNAAADPEVQALLSANQAYYLDKIARLYRLAAPRPHGVVISEKIGLGIELDLLAALGAPVKPLFLIRDPRDAMLSMRRFNEKRGIYEFHEPRTKHFNEVVFQTALDLLNFTRAFDRWPGDKLLVRYDELIAEPQRVLRAMLDFLGIKSKRTTVAKSAVAAIPDIHLTSTSAAESIGAWQHVLTPSEIATVNWYFQAFLQRFGFS